MTLLGTSGTLTIAPNFGLVAWMVLVGMIWVMGAVGAMKARWRWLVIGLLTAGLGRIVAAFGPAAPHSLWSRWFSSRQA